MSNQNQHVPGEKEYKGISTVDDSFSDWGRYDISIIKQDIINHFHIRQGEKLNDPTFGTILWDILYEPLTEKLKRFALEDVTRILKFDPRVQVQSIVLDSFRHGITVECVVKFLPYNISEKMRFEFNQNSPYLS